MNTALSPNYINSLICFIDDSGHLECLLYNSEYNKFSNLVQIFQNCEKSSSYNMDVKYISNKQEYFASCSTSSNDIYIIKFDENFNIKDTNENNINCYISFNINNNECNKIDSSSLLYIKNDNKYYLFRTCFTNNNHIFNSLNFSEICNNEIEFIGFTFNEIIDSTLPLMESSMILSSTLEVVNESTILETAIESTILETDIESTILETDSDSSSEPDPESDTSKFTIDNESTILETKSSILQEAESSILYETKSSILQETESSFLYETESSLIQETESSILQATESSLLQGTESSILQETESSILQETESSILQETESSFLYDTESSILQETES